MTISGRAAVVAEAVAAAACKGAEEVAAEECREAEEVAAEECKGAEVIVAAFHRAVAVVVVRTAVLVAAAAVPPPEVDNPVSDPALLDDRTPAIDRGPVRNPAHGRRQVVTDPLKGSFRVS